MALSRLGLSVAAVVFAWSQLSTAAISAAPEAPQFKFEEVDRAANGNRQIGIEIDEQGAIHLAYTTCTDSKCKNNELAYNIKVPGSPWSKYIIDNEKKDTGWFTALAFTASKQPYIFYANHFDEPVLRQATRDAAGKWSKKVIGTAPGGYWPSVAALGDDLYVAHTSFRRKSLNEPALEVGSFSATKGTWRFEEVDASLEAGWFTQLALDPLGQPVVSYVGKKYPNGELRVAARQLDGKWKIETLDSEVIKHTLLVDGEGFVHIAYNRINEEYQVTKELMYATNSPDGQWHISRIDGAAYPKEDTGYFPHMIFDRNGGLHVAYWDKFHDALGYARNTAGTWEAFQVTKNREGCYYPRLAFDSKGALHVACDTGYNIRHAVCESCLPKGGTQ